MSDTPRTDEREAWYKEKKELERGLTAAALKAAEERRKRRELEMTSKERRDMYHRNIKSGLWAYDEEYDSYYETRTGKWVEETCTDEECEFCKDRPDRHERSESEGGKIESKDGETDSGTRRTKQPWPFPLPKDRKTI